MNLEKYSLRADSSLEVFEFISKGPNGLIRKGIHFQQTNIPKLYNLALGDIDAETGLMDYLAVSNNADTEKVLATVAGALCAFFDKHPGTFVYATGSTSSRTRLYRMALTKYYREVTEDFTLYGQIGKEFFEFEPGETYDGFLAEKKIE